MANIRRLAERQSTLPAEVLVYVADWTDGKPVWAVAVTVADIPAHCAMCEVGVYEIVRAATFEVSRALKESNRK